MLKSISYIYQNFNENISLADLLKIACMSRTGYLNKFKQITGLSPKQLQTNYKISIAKSLLAQTNKTISEISDKLTFYDVSHFTRIFTRQAGMSPNEYRKSKQLKNS
jgi:AraC-like DNA-binding protein